MRLVINEPGLFIGTKSGMIIVYKKRQKVLEVPVSKINLVTVLTRGASFSSALLRLLLKHNIPIIFYSSYGKPIAQFKGFTSGSIELRKKQYEAKEKEKGVKLAKAFAKGKILNQYNLLYSMARNRSKSNPQLAKELYEITKEIRYMAEEIEKIDGKCVSDVQKDIINIEAEVAKIYWEGIAKAISNVIYFPGRKKRFENPSDPINISLNYLYSILAGECWINIEIHGLDAFAGFLHSDSPRRPALVMDLIEEFRQPIVDRIVFKMIYEKKIDESIIENNRLKRECKGCGYYSFCKRL
jgi:CRISPR-associated protein Cas1